MHCPFCQHLDTRVIDSRVSDDGATIRRRRVCEACGERCGLARARARHDEQGAFGVLNRGGLAIVQPGTRKTMIA